MANIEYLNEHLWIHYFGHALIILSFFSAVFIFISGINYKYSKSELNKIQWLQSIKIGFAAHVMVLFTAIGLIFYMMDSHYFEFNYVWSHVSDELARRYILSAFWEGQEGSFLLWMFWNCILGLFFWKKLNARNIAVITVIAGVQFILNSMILGVHVFESRIGSSPFALLRHVMDIPLFKNAEYVSLIKGNGLNPLLQNYWMTIHPPTLFLGFASTIIPFAFAVHSLWNKDFKEWLAPALKWCLFSAAILGLGILMGGAWAYEALSFGGYWAWDPVENMSLVPWIILVAGIHSHLITLNTNYSTKATILFYIFSFALVVYSSFLTRSGILGDSSVHAFTQMGLEWQLIIFCLTVICVPLFLYFKNVKSIPLHAQEEKNESREFWMFIGCLVLMFSAGLITFTTSIPVYNKLLDVMGSIFGSDMTTMHRSPPVNVVDHHNRFQIWIAVFIALLSAGALFLRYCGTHLSGLQKGFWKKIITISILAIIATSIVFQYLDQKHWSIFMLMLSAFWSLFASGYILVEFIKQHTKLSTAALAHLGFGILILGIIFTGINKRNFQPDAFFQKGLVDDEVESMKNFLIIKGEPTIVENYKINYKADSMDRKVRRYQIDFTKLDSVTNKTESFTVRPEIQYDNKLTKVAASNPSTKHYLHKDIFTIISQIPKSQMDATSANQAEDSMKYELYASKMNDTFFTQQHYAIIRNIRNTFEHNKHENKSNEQQIELDVVIKSLKDTNTFTVHPGIVFQDNLVYRYPDQINKLGMRIQIPDSIFALLSNSNGSTKTTIKLKQGESKTIEGINITLRAFEKNPENALYKPLENDIALAAVLDVEYHDYKAEHKPLFIIRESRTFSIPSSTLLPGININFDKVDPNTQEMTFTITKKYDDIASQKIPIEISENAPRTDYIVMEVIEFPGINLVWLGSLLMVFGLLISSYNRYKK